MPPPYATPINLLDLLTPDDLRAGIADAEAFIEAAKLALLRKGISPYAPAPPRLLYR